MIRMMVSTMVTMVHARDAWFHISSFMNTEVKSRYAGCTYSSEILRKIGYRKYKLD